MVDLEVSLTLLLLVDHLVGRVLAQGRLLLEKLGVSNRVCINEDVLSLHNSI